MPIRKPYAYLSDNVLWLVGLTNDRTDALVSTATVTCTVIDDRTQAAVATGTWPLAMPAVTGKPGSYNCVLPVELALTLKGQYTAVVSADAGPGLRTRYIVPMVVQSL